MRRGRLTIGVRKRNAKLIDLQGKAEIGSRARVWGWKVQRSKLEGRRREKRGAQDGHV
ncbi:MAG TPA: hypothetical protein VEI54_01235 [Candidatus Limnocylindrales bacterium]|nr:hypothetical protein [Candidatus Limnocylindrales bacterium]